MFFGQTNKLPKDDSVTHAANVARNTQHTLCTFSEGKCDASCLDRHDTRWNKTITNEKNEKKLQIIMQLFWIWQTLQYKYRNVLLFVVCCVSTIHNERSIVIFYNCQLVAICFSFVHFVLIFRFFIIIVIFSVICDESDGAMKFFCVCPLIASTMKWRQQRIIY